MARTTRKSLASSAASAARKVIKRKPSAKATPTTEAPAKKAATATKTAARKTPSTTKAAAKKTPAKKSSAKKAPAKKAPAAKTSATKAAAKKTATKKTATKKTATKKAPAKKATTKKTAAKKATDKAPAKKATTRAAATKSPAKTATTRAAATKAPAKKTSAKQTPAKKTVAKKASALKVREGEGAWTKAEIKEVLDELHEDRERVTRALHAQEAELVGLMRDAGDGAGQDQADMGATSFERDHELTVLNNEREKLAQIDRALARIEDGSYGICESCGNPIGKMRAMAFPRATLCLTCKQREERR
ncbi:MAG: TraR/DksA family transcriptional regulator [Nocardioides sp.]